jgi:hypothetical protein
MNPFIVATTAVDLAFPGGDTKFEGECRAYASNGSWRFRIPHRFSKAAGLAPGHKLQLFRHAEGWSLQSAGDTERLSNVTVDFEQKIQLHTIALGLAPTSRLQVTAIDNALILRPIGESMPEIDVPAPADFGAFGWRSHSVASLKNREHIKFLDVQGQFLQDTGLMPGDRVQVTMFEDRVSVMRHENGPLLCMDKKTFPGFRLSSRYFEQFGNLDSVIMVYGTAGVMLVPSKDSLAKFGLAEKDELRVSMADVVKQNFAKKHQRLSVVTSPEFAVPDSSAADAESLEAVAWTVLPVRDSGKVRTRHIDIVGHAGKIVGFKRGMSMQLHIYSDQVMLIKSEQGGVKCARLDDSLGVRLKTRFFDWLLDGDEVVAVLGTKGIAILRSMADLARFSLTMENRLEERLSA